MARSAPSSTQTRHFSSLPAVANTVAPNARASWIAVVPMPLVHGGTSGIGTTATQLARALGATVFATAGSEEKCRVCVELGAERAINYRELDFAKEFREIDLVLDMVGAPYTPRNLEVLAARGRLVQISYTHLRA